MTTPPQDDQPKGEVANITGAPLARKDAVLIRTKANGTPIVLSKHTLERVHEVILTIDDAEGEGLDRLLTQILGASSWDELDDPWDTTRSEELFGRQLCINSLLRRPSDYKGGLGWFLVVFAVDTTTGEETVFTSGAFSVVAQLAVAHAMGWLPLHAKLVKADRPTDEEYYPQHIEFIGKPPAVRADAQ